MSTSKVQIWNAALSHIQHKALIRDPDERTVEASYCNTFYPFALEVTLERYDWNFARRREQGAQVTNDLNHWMFAYAKPSGCVAMRAVLLPESTNDYNEQSFGVEGDTIYTNVEEAVLKFTGLVTDTSKFSPMFAMSLSYDLAALLAGPIPRDPRLKQTMLNAAAGYVNMAAASDANTGQRDGYKDFIPDMLKARQ
jgi:hypothetical protein